ncbi:modifier of mdg4-like isoform X5 [Anopheles moucheti]|uniref:modifier of mdg4-like isoform X5 n=1 Tax=Anopheles moucheti TaxID=186751 RepID=UPI0022F0044C|nr:modifier of mdg4-like isoform X5 [Anopheles moucheti]
MADDEQFSLCWNNFNSNLSAGFHESLQRGDLVDVTLAAEGQLVQAHRLVLSVCSPYFRKMFNQMPKNQHAFVFLKDVTHAALQDLIQFMYCGEVNVKQDALPAFISTAEALQIKGLTETGDSAPSQQSPVKEDVSAVPSTTASISTTVPAASQRTKVQRNRVQSSYKIESEESGDDKIHIQASTSHHVSAQQLQTQTNISSQKRTMPQRGITSHTIKRQKISISASSDGMDTSDTAPSQTQTVQTVQIVKQLPAQVIEPEYIELPMESINPKAEPDYTDETAEIETVDAETEQEHKLSEQGDADDDGNYVEDETYGDMAMGKYEESYLTEAEDGAKPGASGFVETYASDGGTGTEQSTQEHKGAYIVGQRGSILLSVNGHRYVKNRKGQSKTYWICAKKGSLGCRARVTTTLSENDRNTPKVILTSGTHNHDTSASFQRIQTFDSGMLSNARKKHLPSLMCTRPQRTLHTKMVLFKPPRVGIKTEVKPMAADPLYLFSRNPGNSSSSSSTTINKRLLALGSNEMSKSGNQSLPKLVSFLPKPEPSL